MMDAIPRGSGAGMTEEEEDDRLQQAMRAAVMGGPTANATNNANNDTDLEWLRAQQEEELMQAAMDESLREERTRSNRNSNSNASGKRPSWMQNEQEREMMELAMERSLQCNTNDATPAAHSRRAARDIDILQGEEEDMPSLMGPMDLIPSPNAAAKMPPPASNNEDEVSIHSNNWLYPHSPIKDKTKTNEQQEGSWLDRKPGASPTPSSPKKPPPQYAATSNQSRSPTSSPKKPPPSAQSTHTRTRDGTRKSWLRLEQEQEMYHLGVEQSNSMSPHQQQAYHGGHARSKSYDDADDYDDEAPPPRRRSDEMHRISTNSTTRDGTRRSWLRTLEQEEEMLQFGRDHQGGGATPYSNHSSKKGHHRRSKSYDDADEYDFEEVQSWRMSGAAPFRESTHSTTRDGTRRSWLQHQQEDEMLQMGMEQSMHQQQQRSSNTAIPRQQQQDAYKQSPRRATSPPVRSMLDDTIPQHDPLYDETRYGYENRRGDEEDPNHKRCSDGPAIKTSPRSSPRGDRMAQSSYEFRSNRRRQFEDIPDTAPIISNPREDGMAQSSYDYRARRGSDGRSRPSGYGNDNYARLPDRMAYSSYEHNYQGGRRGAPDYYTNSRRPPEDRGDPFWGHMQRAEDRMAFSSYDNAYDNGYDDSRSRASRSLSPRRISQPVSHDHHDNHHRSYGGEGDLTRHWDPNRIPSAEYASDSRRTRKSRSLRRRREQKEEIPLYPQLDEISVTDAPKTQADPFPVVTPSNPPKENKRNKDDNDDIPLPSNWEEAKEWEAKLQSLTPNRQSSPKPERPGMGVKSASAGSHQAAAGALGTSQKEWEAKMNSKLHDFRASTMTSERPGMGRKSSSAGASNAAMGALGKFREDVDPMHDFKVAQAKLAKPGIAQRNDTTGSSPGRPMQGSHTTDCAPMMSPAAGDGRMRASQAAGSRPELVRGGGSGRSDGAGSGRIATREDEAKDWDARMAAKLHDYRAQSGSGGRSMSPAFRASARSSVPPHAGQTLSPRQAQSQSSSRQSSRSPMRKSHSTLGDRHGCSPSPTRSPIRKTRSTLDGHSFRPVSPGPQPGSRPLSPVEDSPKKQKGGRLFKKLFKSHHDK